MIAADDVLLLHFCDLIGHSSLVGAQDHCQFLKIDPAVFFQKC